MRAGTMLPITITLPPGMTEEVDTLCKKSERNRSEVVREAIRSYMSKDSALESTPTSLAEAVRRTSYSDAYLREAAIDFETHPDFEMARTDASAFEAATVDDGLTDNQ